MLKPWIAPVLALCAASALAVPLKPVRTVEGVIEYRLANGLQVLLAPDASKPSTTVNMTYRVGSKHENYGETGMAHLLEHLIFKGTPTHRQVMAEFAQRGFDFNGTTWTDRTNYYASFAANPADLRWYLRWQADAMVNSLIARKDLNTEMTVVRNEMEMGENSPANIVSERLLATMFQWHNYGKSTIGARSDVENVDIGRLQAFYRQYYQPDNATLIVTGRFDPSQTLAWITQSFGPLKKPQRTLPRLYTLDPAQDGERQVSVRRSGGTPTVAVGYHVPAATHPDYAAVELLGALMGEAPSGRLHKGLVEQHKLATSVSGGAYAFGEPTVLSFGADALPGADPQPLAQALVAELEAVAQRPFLAEELERARKRWLNRWAQLFADPQQIGFALSEAVAVGDWRFFFLLRDRIQALQLADLQRVAQERLLPANRTLVLYIPTEKPQRAPAPQAVDVADQLRTFQPAAAQAEVAAFDTDPLRIEAQVQRFELPSGARLALLPKPTRGGLVKGRVQLRFGTAQSLRDQGAVSDLLASLINEGSERLGREALRDRMDALRMELQLGYSADSVILAWTSTREHAVAAAELALELLRHPRLDPAVFEEQRQLALAQVDAAKSEPEQLAPNALALARNHFPTGDPRHAQSFADQAAALKAVSLDQVREFHRRHYGADHLRLALVGDFDAAALRAALTPLLQDWRALQPPQRLTRPWADLPAKRLSLPTPDKQNATLAAALSVPVKDSDADFVPLMLANAILGESTDSRLWVRIREKEGLSYGTWAALDWNTQEAHSVWNFGALFAPQNRARVEAALREELARALKEGFTAQELARAQRAQLSSRALARAQDGGLAAALSSQADLGRTLKHSAAIDAAIQNTTLEQVNAALRRHLKPEAMQLVWAGDFGPTPEAAAPPPPQGGVSSGPAKPVPR
ncbi:zinc protease [Inhella inkyongensis]|uniref:Zinc protease n=1 Tax=Inhella inkyongensis TaxID=392593 RepID=A0A840SBG7_9BURK|nr:pitrilysin family protein [Inhella inkyongensis]MBB5205811.1 zinc protease [Inhella inkyongensis]